MLWLSSVDDVRIEGLLNEDDAPSKTARTAGEHKERRPLEVNGFLILLGYESKTILISSLDNPRRKGMYGLIYISSIERIHHYAVLQIKAKNTIFNPNYLLGECCISYPIYWCQLRL